MRSSTTGPDDDRPVAELCDEGCGRGDRVVRVRERAAEDADELVSVDAGDDVEAGMPGGAPQGVDDGCRRRVRRGTGDREDVGGARPAEGGGPGEVVVADVAADQGVGEQRLEAGVPGAAHLGGLRVDLGCGEGDLAGEDEDGLAQLGLVAWLGELGGVLLDDLDRGADELDGLLQGDHAGQLARGRAEDLGGDGARGVRSAAPGDERADPGLGDQGDPGAVLG